jgi:hypothetical protein
VGGPISGSSCFGAEADGALDMTQYHRLKRKRLSDLIVDEGLADKEVVLAALHEQQASGELLSTVMLASQEFDAFDLARVIVEQYQIPFIELSLCTGNKDVVKEFPAELLHRERIFPLERFGDHVSFVCQEIPSSETHKKLKEIVSGSVLVFAGLSRDIEEKLREFAPYERTEQVAPIERVEPIMDPEEAAHDREWQSLFDTANESVMSEMDIVEPD